jgi:hypothetical protein
MYIIDQAPFNSDSFCKEVTENIKKYAEMNDFKYTDLLRAKRLKDRDGYEWHVDVDMLLENIPVVDFLKTALDERYPEQTKLLLQELSFSTKNLLEKISTLVSSQSFETTLIADCKEIHASNTAADVYTGALIDYEAPRTVIGLFFNKNYCKLIDCEDFSKLLDKKLLIQGTVSYFQKMNCFQIKASSIKVIGECTRLQKLNHWENICADILRTWEGVQPYPEPTKKPDKIILVGNSDTQGYNDFVETFKKSFGKNAPHLEKHNVDTMTVENIVPVLESLQNETDIDYVAIVRGGGDKESLAQYCEPSMLRAIHALGNVVTGIGHSDDKLLCGRAALYDAGTPTAAAQFIKTMDNNFSSQERRKKAAREIKEALARTGFKNDKERAEHWEKAYKQLKKAYDELLEDSKTKGLRRILKNLFG